MIIEMMNEFEETYTQFLCNIPEGYHFSDLTFSTERPLTLTMKDRFTDIAERHYAKWEIIGETYTDFFEGLQLSLDLHGDTFERLLEVYDSDIAKPILGREEVTTYDLTNSSELINSQTISERIDIPIDNVLDDKPSSRDKSNASSEAENKQIGTVTHTLSDLGVRPNYESLNGFLDENRTADMIFVKMFKDNFTMRQVLKW